MSNVFRGVMMVIFALVLAMPVLAQDDEPVGAQGEPVGAQDEPADLSAPELDGVVDDFAYLIDLVQQSTDTVERVVLVALIVIGAGAVVLVVGNYFVTRQNPAALVNLQQHYAFLVALAAVTPFEGDDKALIRLKSILSGLGFRFDEVFDETRSEAVPLAERGRQARG